MSSFLRTVVLTVVFALTSLFVLAQTEATVYTDKPDYMPGETVIIEGDGWQPGELVRLEIDHSTVTHGNTVLYASADASGHISNSEFIIQQIHLHEVFALTATGNSGTTARANFTDGLKTWTPFGGSIDWHSPANWSPFGVPTSSDDVSIPAGSTVNISAPANALSILLLGGNASSSITLTSDLIVGVNVTIQAPTQQTRFNRFNANSGLFIIGNNLNIDGSGSGVGNIGEFRVAGAMVSVAGNISVTSSNFARLTLINPGHITVAGNFALGAAGTFSGGDGTFEYNGSFQTVTPADYYNLSISGSGTKTLSGPTYVANVCAIAQNNTLDISTRTLSSRLGNWSMNVNGTVDFSSSTGSAQSGPAATTATLTMGATGRLKTVDDLGIGPVANASLQGTWNTASISTAGTVEYYRSTSGNQTITDRDYYSLVITNATPSKVWSSNGNSRTINGSFTNNGTASLNVSPMLFVKGHWTWAGGGSIPPVTFNGTTTQNITTPILGAVVLNNPNGIKWLSGSLVDNLTLTNGIIDVATSNSTLTLFGIIIGGGPSSYVKGKLEKRFLQNSGAQTFKYPIGNATTYAPMTVSFANPASDLYLIGSVSSTNDNEPSGIHTSKRTDLTWLFERNTNYGTLANYDMLFDASYTNNSGVAEGSISNYIVRQFSSNSWLATTNTIVSNTAGNRLIKATGLTGFGAFRIGETACVSPSITDHPSVPSSTCTGSGTQVLSVSATGDGLGYSWRKDGVPVMNSSVFSGQGTNTLTITNPTESDAGSYDVIVSGTCSPSATSNAVTVTVTAKSTWYIDADGDHYSSSSTLACARPSNGFLLSELTAAGGGIGDCNDNNSSVNPGATETCNGIDDNCNGQTDEGFIDSDNDGIKDCVDADDDNDGVADGDDCAPLNPSPLQISASVSYSDGAVIVQNMVQNTDYTFSGSPASGSQLRPGGRTLFYTNLNTNFSRLWWTYSAIGNPWHSSQGSATGNMNFAGYDAATGIATWVSTANVTWPLAGGGSAGTATRMRMQLQPHTGVHNGGPIANGFIVPVTAGSIGLNALSPSGWILNNLKGLGTNKFQVWIIFETISGTPLDSYFASTPNAGGTLFTSTTGTFYSKTAAGCNGNGLVTITASGGSPSYTGTGTFSVGAGPHTFTVTDANGCTATTNVVVSPPPTLQAASSVSFNSGGALSPISFSGYSFTSGGNIPANAGGRTWMYNNINDAAYGQLMWTLNPIGNPWHTSQGGPTGNMNFSGYNAATGILTWTSTQNITWQGVNGPVSRQTRVRLQLQPYTGSHSGPLNAGWIVPAAIGSTGLLGMNISALSAPKKYQAWYIVEDVQTGMALNEFYNNVANSINGGSTNTSISGSFFGSTPSYCQGGTQALINVSATGGTPAYTGTGNFFVGAGNYSYTVTDANGCTSTTTGTVVFPARNTFYADADGDGFGNPAVSMQVCGTTPPQGYVADNTDCAPADVNKWQSANLYIDADGDGYTTGQQFICYGNTIPVGYSVNSLGTDNCPSVANPSQTDNDNDGQGDACDTDDDNDGVLDVNDNCPLTPNTNQANNDGDATGDACDDDDDNDGVLDVNDCAPFDNSKWQSALLYIDADGDGYDAGQATVCYGASYPSMYKATTLGTDCKDDNAAINPGAIEICNNIDDDCDGVVDDGFINTVVTCAQTGMVTKNLEEGGCSYTVNATEFDATVSQNCGPLGYTLTGATTGTGTTLAGVVFNTGTTKVTWSATNTSGQVFSCSFDVKVVPAPPVITCPQDIIVNNDANACGAVVNYIPTSIIRFSETFTQGATASSTICASWLSFRSSLVPNTYSRVTMKGSLNPIGVSMTNSTLVTQLAELIRTGTSGSVSDGSHTWYVGKGCNTSGCVSAGQGVEVRIDEPNFCICSNKMVIRPDINNLNWGGLGGTNCNAPSQTMIIEFEIDNGSSGFSTSSDCSSPLQVSQTAGLPSGATFPVGTTTNTYQVTDNFGQTTTCSFTVTVNDNQAPTVVQPQNITGSTTIGQCAASVDYAGASASDNCSVTSLKYFLNYSTSPQEITFPKTFAVGSYVVTVEAKDAAGNTTLKNFGITVKDEEEPTLIKGSIASCYKTVAEAKAAAIAATQYSDNCTVNANLHVLATVSGTCSAEVSVMVTDAAGNTSTVKYNTRIDNTAPLLSGKPADVTVKCPANVPSVYTATAVDNCDGNVAVNYSENSTQGSDPLLSSYYNYTIKRKWETEDGCGNKESHTQTITVQDDVAPVLTCPQNIVESNTTGTCGRDISFAASVTDCSPVELKYYLYYGEQTQALITSGENFAVGSYNVTVIAKDVSGNTSNCSFTITVKDTEKPVLVKGSIQSCYATQAEAEWAALEATGFSDNCTDLELLSVIPSTSGTCSAVIRVTVTDLAGNSHYVEYNTKIDNTKPVLSAKPADVTVNCQSVPGVPTITANDNCDGALEVSYNELSNTKGTDPALSSYYNYEIKRQWSVSDGCGNTESHIQTITVQDITKPQISCPPNQLLVPFDFDKLYATINVGTAGATDNCAAAANILIAGVRSDNVPISDQQFPLGLTTIQWTATDPSNNSDNCTQNISVRKRNTTVSYTGEMNSSNQICVQYSDIIQLQARLTDNEGSPFTNISGRSVVFQLLSSSNVVLRTKTAITNSSGIAEDTFKIVQAPGTYSIKTSFAGDANFNGNEDNDPTIVKQEDAIVDYSGSQYFTTPSSTNFTGSVNFQASVNDIDDGTDKRGDIRKAKITFRDGGPAGATLGTANNIVGLVNPGVLTEGVSSTSQNFTLNNNEASGGGRIFQVWVGASDHYTGADAGPTPVTLALPGQDYVTGGGHYIMNNSSGTYAGTANARMNFGFTMKWNKSGKNLQGQINIVYRRWELFQGVMQWRIYQIKSNAINSMAVQAAGGFNKAIINTKATLNDVTDPLAVVSYGGGHDLTLEAWDNTTNTGGTLDKIGVRLVSGSSEMLFVSSWSSSALQIQQITGGNVNVRSNNGAVPPSSPVAKENTSSAITKGVAEDMKPFEVKAYPNPSHSYFTVRIETDDKKQPVTLKVVDVHGRVIEVRNKLSAGQLILVGDTYLPGTYILQLWQGTKHKEIKLVKQ